MCHSLPTFVLHERLQVQQLRELNVGIQLLLVPGLPGTGKETARFTLSCLAAANTREQQPQQRASLSTSKERLFGVAREAPNWKPGDSLALAPLRHKS